jgi:hypothetical protein
LVSVVVACSSARRIALTDSETVTPYLWSNNAALQWNSADMMRLLHQSQAVEVGARGVRFVGAGLQPSVDLKFTAQDRCNGSSSGALCDTGNGLLFPSSGAIVVTGLPSAADGVHFLENHVARMLAQETACNERGDGRVVVMNETVYTASACDVMQGRYVALFWPGRDEVALLPQTFGPMAYTMILVTCIICIYGASSLEQSSWQKYVTWGVSAAGTLACILLYAISGITFLTVEDEAHFWMSVIGTIFIIISDIVAVRYFGTEKILIQHVKGIDLCIYMLGSIADALYRSPETPYAAIFVTGLAIRAWQKIFSVFFDIKDNTAASVAVLLHVKLCYNLIYLCLTIESGLVCQYVDDEDWPVYGGMGALATLLAAWSAR